MATGHVEVVINLDLVRLIKLRHCEDRHNSKDDECHAVEPGSYVRQYPQQQTKLEGVDQVLDEEESAELPGGVVHVTHDVVQSHLGLVLRNINVQVQVPSERMWVTGFLHCLENVLVHTKAERDGEDS